LLLRRYKLSQMSTANFSTPAAPLKWDSATSGQCTKIRQDQPRDSCGDDNGRFYARVLSMSCPHCVRNCVRTPARIPQAHPRLLRSTAGPAQSGDIVSLLKLFGHYIYYRYSREHRQGISGGHHRHHPHVFHNTTSPRQSRQPSIQKSLGHSRKGLSCWLPYALLYGTKAPGYLMYYGQGANRGKGDLEECLIRSHGLPGGPGKYQE